MTQTAAEPEEAQLESVGAETREEKTYIKRTSGYENADTRVVSYKYVLQKHREEAIENPLVVLKPSRPTAARSRSKRQRQGDADGDGSRGEGSRTPGVRCAGG